MVSRNVFHLLPALQPFVRHNSGSNRYGEMEQLSSMLSCKIGMHFCFRSHSKDKITAVFERPVSHLSNKKWWTVVLEAFINLCFVAVVC